MQKGLYAIKLQDGSEIEIAFTTWVFKKFAQSKNLSVDQMLDYMSGKLDIKGEKSKITTEDMLLLMQYGAEFMHLKAKKPFTYTEFDVTQWLDEMGGLTSVKLKEMTLVMFSALVDKDPTEVAQMIEVVDTEKKSSHGTASTSAQQKQGSSRVKPTAKR